MTLIRNWEINNVAVGTLWFAASGGIAYWFHKRRTLANDRLKGNGDHRPTSDEVSLIHARLTLDAFLAMGGILVLFVVLDWLW